MILNLENNSISLIISKKILLPKINMVKLPIRYTYYEYYKGGNKKAEGNIDNATRSLLSLANLANLNNLNNEINNINKVINKDPTNKLKGDLSNIISNNSFLKNKTSTNDKIPAGDAGNPQV